MNAKAGYVVGAMGALLALNGCAAQSAAPLKPDLTHLQYSDPHFAHHHHDATQPVSSPVLTRRELRGPNDFMGAPLFDDKSARLFYLSYGPPANPRGASTLYELDPHSGKMLAHATMPFHGMLSSPVVIDGVLYEGVFHESKIYRVSIERSSFGKVLGNVSLPHVDELLGPDDQEYVYRFPFFSFNGMVATPDGKLLLHSDDLGELLTVEPQTGKVVHRVKTLRAINSMAAVRGPDGAMLIVANANPREAAVKAEMRKFMFRGKAGIAPMASASSEEDGVEWLLVNPASGEVLMSTWQPMTDPFAGNLTLLKHETADRSPFGRLTLLVTARDGLLTVEWTPAEAPADTMGRTNASLR